MCQELFWSRDTVQTSCPLELRFYDHWHLSVLGSGELDSKRGWRWEQRLGAPGLRSSQIDIYGDHGGCTSSLRTLVSQFAKWVALAILFWGGGMIKCTTILVGLNKYLLVND